MIIKCVPCAFYTLSYRSWFLCVPGISIFALLLRNISYKYNKCVSFFIEDIPASVLKSECAIYVSMIIDLRAPLKVSKTGFVISKHGCRRCSLKPVKLEWVAMNKCLIKLLLGIRRTVFQLWFRTCGVSFSSWRMCGILINTDGNHRHWGGSWPHVPLCPQNISWNFLPWATQMRGGKKAKEEGNLNV